MNKRLGIIIFGMCVLVLLLALIIAIVTIPAFAYVFGTLAFLLIGGFQFYLGIYQIQRAKAQGQYIPWWKQPFIFIALGLGCLAAMLLTRQLTSGRVILFPFLLLSICLDIYAIVLTFQQSIRRRDLRNH